MSYRDDILAPARWLRDLWVSWVRKPAKSRIDRSRMYLWVHCGLVVSGGALLAHPFGPGVLSYYSQEANKTLAVCIIVGSTTCVLGSLMGTRFWFPSAITDVRLPYLFAIGGQISVITSLVTFEAAAFVHNDVNANLSGALAFSIIGGCTQTALVALKEMHRINRLERIVRRGQPRRRRRTLERQLEAMTPEDA